MKLYDFMQQRFTEGGFSTEDTLACLLPLLKQVAELHEQQQVAPLQGIEFVHVEDAHAYVQMDELPEPKNNSRLVRQIELSELGAVDVVDRNKSVIYVGAGTHHIESAQIVERDSPIDHPVYVPGYLSWEHLLEHHDPLTDVFCLGQILASVALGLDFTKLDDVKKFVKHRRNLFAINRDVHPVIARAIVRMTELHRERRVQELPLLIRALENYRQQETEISVEPEDIEGFESRDLQGKQQVLLDRLQKRLFEISRRNRMLHFRDTMQAVNLTQASVPLSFDYKNIRDDQILVCDRKLEQSIANGKNISLNKRLNFSEAIYLPQLLTRIARESRRDSTEYGFEQLRLVLCTLHWSNLKEKPPERFRSPLVLVPVKLIKKRGVRDTWTVQPLSNDAEVNPVIRYLFRQLYNIQLPQTIDLETAGLESLYTFMRDAIAATESAVELRKIEKPQIRLLHASAKRKLENYRRRAGISGRGIRTFRDIDYSYDPATYNPLGIKIFSEFLRRPVTELSAITSRTVSPRHYAVPEKEDGSTNPSVDPPEGQQEEREHPSQPGNGQPEKKETATEPVADVTIGEQQFFDLQTDDGKNPYDWSFDLCNVTLANFRYRKMSLVRDYETLVDETPHNAAFEAAFSLVPRSTERVVPETPPVVDRYDVVNCDPTQATSIAQARVGETYIIQGPPGTGKSQTITNLIADYAARGKRVLFVCEKRAAIDVVFARLRKCGLGDLCSLIHDSQADKKSFVMDLKATYQSFLETKPDPSVDTRRNQMVTGMYSAAQPLQEYGDGMRETTYRGGVPTHQILEEAIRLSDECPELTELEKEQLPSWGSWYEGRESIDAMVETLKRQQPDGILARHPLRNLDSSLVQQQQPMQIVTEALAKAKVQLQSLNELIGDVPWGIDRLSIANLKTLVDHCHELLPLAKSKVLTLLDQDSAAFRQLAKSMLELKDHEKVVQQLREENSAWKKRIERRDLRAAIDTANSLSKRWVPIIRPSWWRMRRVMNDSYDFDSHPVKPSWVSVLSSLQREYDAEDVLDKQKSSIARQFGLSENLDEQLELMDRLKTEADSHPDWLREIHNHLIDSEQDQLNRAAIATKLASGRPLLYELRQTTDEVLDAWKVLNCDELACEFDTVEASLDLLPDYMICLQQLSSVPEEARAALQRLSLRPEQIEAASAKFTFQRNERENLAVKRFDQVVRRQHVERLEKYHSSWMDSNASFVRQQTQRRFLQNAHQQHGEDGQETAQFKRAYAAGRKVLEHEFGKQMRYKSIRDLVSGDSGLVVRDLKPIWLMSPLSVSDTLPLGAEEGDGNFDVVIFDEASQITLEEAVPSMFRADQAIVVGDEQQLPPTDFFSAKKDRDADDEITFEHEGETVTYDLESNSLLNHAARNMASTMLGWHYRSRDEALISFSNWAFYNGQLLTIPEESILAEGRPALEAMSADDAVAHAESISDRPLSFHFLNHGIYHKRRNRAEAEYIAMLVSELLKKKDGRTIGVIAFSEAQQGEIEEAMDRLAKTDAEFSALLEAELVREEDGQFVGLLVKNLENIQGDERDIILLSVCYAPDEDGRMIMNFGPINKSGGEKRLNVAFSRAKHHMAVISTIRYGAITNEYNTGANCLRNYLRYSEALSSGDGTTANTVLHGLLPTREANAADKPVAGSLRQISARLQQCGFEVDFNIGNSDFRCDLGIRKEGDMKYRLGILVDSGNFYESDVDLIDRELFRPRLLKIFGWDTYSILLKDWLADSDRIVDEIVDLCHGADPVELDPEPKPDSEPDSDPEP